MVCREPDFVASLGPGHRPRDSHRVIGPLAHEPEIFRLPLHRRVDPIAATRVIKKDPFPMGLGSIFRYSPR
jgi:hypothetical protein